MSEQDQRQARDMKRRKKAASGGGSLSLSSVVSIRGHKGPSPDEVADFLFSSSTPQTTPSQQQDIKKT